MTPAQLDTARALVASPHWRWLPGMRAVAWGSMLARCVTLWGNPWMAEEEEAALCTASHCGASVSRAAALVAIAEAPFAPDLTDPTTTGCLAHLACAAHGHILYAVHDDGIWYVVYQNPDIPTRSIQVAYDPCLGSAWAAAILAAPERTP